ncbi:hypothetical protein DQ04_09991030 [Trypanosoma grayi]|uniref:hypothetical protein n=1 Tax=Trypanosoma grayi TaxID=71804 RepID=UPI0004F4AB6C|nr:hypothetical protein DQ04_09991030 [Trypanosoma grayi]KEG07377.1 hypothetical protein DQ04_09991030 [Trypanosoma grayi]
MRSTTPPLYYRRPEGVPVSYYTAVAAREVPPSLRVPPAAAYNRGPAMPTGSAHADQTSHVPLSCSSNTIPSVPPVANPFGVSNPSPRASVTGDTPADLLQQSTARWSTTANQCTHTFSALETEEASLLLEEQAMRAKLAELQLTRQRQSEEQLNLSQGWAALLDREERYFTEPLVDMTEEVLAREQQCALLQDQLQQAEAHLETLRREQQQYDAVVEEKQTLEKEMQRVREGFLAIEGRRKACRVRAERLFDAESKRAVEAARRVRELDAHLKDMTSSGPLAEGRSAPSSRSTSRGVTFAQKSIILDVGPNAGEGGDEEGGADAGLTQGVGDASVCLQDDDEGDENNLGGIGGMSAAYSLSLLKRTRVEVPTA